VYKIRKYDTTEDHKPAEKDSWHGSENVPKSQETAAVFLGLNKKLLYYLLRAYKL